MTSNNEKGNFWTTLPGILTGFAAIITAVVGASSAGLIPGINQKPPSPFNSPTPSDTKPQPNPTNSSTKTEELIVNAKSRDGSKFTNEENRTVKVNFKAKGQWLAIPETENFAAKGYISANGFPNFRSNENVPCARFPLAALVVKRENNECIAYGEEASFKLKPNETVYFVMNDVFSLYQDNDGLLTVNLSIQ